LTVPILCLRIFGEDNYGTGGGVKLTYQDLVIEIKRLSPHEQDALLHLLRKLVNDSFDHQAGRATSLARVRGMLKPEGLIPNDEDLTEDYTRYLIKKYI
jgi:hypothetical protein